MIKLVSQYDHPEHHEHVTKPDHVRAAVNEADALQASLSSAVFKLSQAIDIAEESQHFDKIAEGLRGALARVEEEKRARNYATRMQRETDRDR